jgi:RNA-directed DNA polymerase
MKPPSHHTALADALAAAYLEGGEWTAPALAARSRAVLAPPAPRWLAPVAREVVAAYPRPPRDRLRELTAYVALALE